MSGKSMFLSLCHRLRKRFPGVLVQVRRVKIADDCFATTHLDEQKRRFVITIDKNLPEHFACFILVHEWPHAVSYHLDKKEHGPAFWTAMRQSYDVYVKWCSES